jgi:hypothetical protein
MNSSYRNVISAFMFLWRRFISMQKENVPHPWTENIFHDAILKHVCTSHLFEISGSGKIIHNKSKEIDHLINWNKFCKENYWILLHHF